MIPLYRTVIVKLLQQPSRPRSANGGAPDHDDPGARSIEGDPSSPSAQIDVVPSCGATLALGPADRTTVCKGAHRGAQGDPPSVARPRLEPSAAGEAVGQRPGAGEGALPGLRPDLRRREAARTASARPLDGDAAAGDDPGGPVAPTPPAGAASRLAPPARVGWRGGPAPWVRPPPG